jgi:hypothetical protein
MYVVRAPYAVEEARASVVADRMLTELADWQRNLKDVDRQLTKAEAEIERREAAADNIPDAEVIEAATPVPSGVAGNPTQAQVDEARHREGNPYGPPPRRPEHVEKMHTPMKEKPPVKGAAKDSGPWVTQCPDCGCDLYRLRRDIEEADELAAWLDGSTVTVPSLALAVPERNAA